MPWKLTTPVRARGAEFPDAAELELGQSLLWWARYLEPGQEIVLRRIDVVDSDGPGAGRDNPQALLGLAPHQVIGLSSPPASDQDQ